MSACSWLRTPNSFATVKASKSSGTTVKMMRSSLAARNSSPPEEQDLVNNAYAKKLAKAPQIRNVVPQQQALAQQGKEAFDNSLQQYSKISSSEAEFRQLIGE